MALKDDDIRITLKRFFVNGKVSKTNTKSKRRILGIIQATPSKECKKYSISVRYMVPGRNDLFNKGDYEKKKDLLLAYRAFTAKPEVKQIFKDWS